MSENEDYCKKRLSFRYDKGHKGPFLVFLERTEYDRGNEYLHRHDVQRQLFHTPALNKHTKVGYEFKFAGKNRFKFLFDDFELANDFAKTFNLLTSFRLKDEKWEAYIPEFKIHKWFVLHGIEDLEITNEEVMTWLGPYRGEGELPEIVEVERMKKFVPDP